MDGRFIVAELSKNWLDGRSPSELLLCQQFEQVIATNLERGYVLHSFTLHRLMTGPFSFNETLVAVFERGTAPAPGVATPSASLSPADRVRPLASLADMDYDDLEYVRNLGTTGLANIRECMAAHGFPLRGPQ